MACANSEPDVETIRSFLGTEIKQTIMPPFRNSGFTCCCAALMCSPDKGAYPNWRDLQGRTAFDIVLHAQQQKQSLAQPTHVSLSQSVLLMDAKASSFATSGPNNASFSAGPGELSKNSGNEEDLTDDVYNDSSSDGASYDGEEPITSGFYLCLFVLYRILHVSRFAHCNRCQKGRWKQAVQPSALQGIWWE